MAQSVSSSSFSPLSIGVCKDPSLFEKLIGTLPFAPAGLGASIASQPGVSRQIYHHTQKWAERMLDILEDQLGKQQAANLTKDYIKEHPLPQGYTLDNMSNRMLLHALVKSAKEQLGANLDSNPSDLPGIEREILKISGRIEAEMAKGLYCRRSDDPQKIVIKHKPTPHGNDCLYPESDKCEPCYAGHFSV